ncbi:hypothetical protein [Parapedobacter indicus]|uniref:HNH endonuclease n=1 Tax=Parapedobacter indicus TaxID=1477437 RepID=A0A1I3E1B5_9SPHI|nr:hypothetical protein [Parapedobacter indicus]PPL04923.1 hypothetical protein CLV26_101733 [Parapedobacter indicus]SFH92628.1 hypothetical protein SAMN05444682_101719 [Parapedobacter indicus]
MIWTADMDARLRELYPANTNREITAITGWSYYYICERAKVLDLHKGPDARSRACGKTQWTPEMDMFIRQNYERLDNRQIADALGLKLSVTRTRLYELGMKRMQLEYWTEDQVKFLVENYRQIGDLELAEIFESKWPKAKRWTKKHIEKKRRYLKLKRTTAERDAIREGHRQRGVYAEANRRMWQTRGAAKEGEIRYWRKRGGISVFPVIKVDGRWLHWAPWRWEQLRGPVQKGMNVIFADRNPYNRADDNLLLISNAELAKRNSVKSIIGLSDNYVAGILTSGRPDQREIVKQMPDLIELKRNQLLLQRELKEQLK